MAINKELEKIKEILKENPRGMTVTDVSKAIKMNRNSVAKYLEMLVIAGQVDMRSFGPSKVYFVSQRVPISAMLSITSDHIVILNKDLKVIYINDRFLELMDRSREDIVGQVVKARPIPLLSSPDFLEEVAEGFKGKEIIKEICIKKRREELFFNVKLVPSVLEDGGQGLTIIMEDITQRKKAEDEIIQARDELELRVIERTTELARANEALKSDMLERERYAELSDALNAINLTINSTLDFEEVMRRVVTVSAITLKSETSIIAIKEGGQWLLKYSHGITDDIRGSKLSDEEIPRIMQATNSRTPQVISDTYENLGSFGNLIEKYHIRSSILVPLVLKDETTGVIFLNYNSAVHNFTEQEVDFANKLGAAVSLALENARLYAEKVASENRMAESMQMYRDTLENVRLATLVLNRDGRVVYCNNYLLQLLGQKKEEVLGKVWFDSFVPGDQRDSIRKVFEDLIQSGEIDKCGRLEMGINDIKSRELPMLWHNALLRNARGEIIGTSSIGQNPQDIC